MPNLFDIDWRKTMKCTLVRLVSLTCLLAVGTTAQAGSITYWNLFNSEGNSTQSAQFVTYATLSDMLLDANRVTTFTPNTFSTFAASNIVGTGADGSSYWNLFNSEGNSTQSAQFVTYATLSDMLLDANRVTTFTPNTFSTFAASNIVGTGAFFNSAPAPVPEPVPEPSTFVLLGIGGIALIGYGYRRKRQQVKSSRVGYAHQYWESDHGGHSPPYVPEGTSHDQLTNSRG